jgi:hypothetical protein
MPNLVLPIGQTTIGTFALAGFSNVLVTLTPTVWPTTGIIGSVTLNFDDGSIASFDNIPGNPLTFYRGGTPQFGASWPSTAQNVTVVANLLQAVTSQVDVVLG